MATSLEPRPTTSRPPAGWRSKRAAKDQEPKDTRIVDLRTHPANFVSPRQLADYWGRNIETVQRWIRKGALRACKLRGSPSWMIKRTDAVEFEQWSE